jgi:hypothetical protein
MEFGERGPVVRLAFHIINKGNTPATNVQFWACVLPELETQRGNSFEEAFIIPRAWADKCAQIEFGLIVFPGPAIPQEQNHEVEERLFDAIIKDWDNRPPIKLIIAVVMTYRFVGGSGRTECGFRMRRKFGSPEFTDLFYPAEGAVAADHIICERQTLWDSGN